MDSQSDLPSVPIRGEVKTIDWIKEKQKADWSTRSLPSLEGVDEGIVDAFYELFAQVKYLEEKVQKHRHKLQEGLYSEKPAW